MIVIFALFRIYLNVFGRAKVRKYTHDVTMIWLNFDVF